MLKAEAAVDTCIWQGRRVAWFIAAGFRGMQHAILTGSTKLLQELLLTVQGEERGVLTECLHHMRITMFEIYNDKFEYLSHVPFLPSARTIVSKVAVWRSPKKSSAKF